MLLDAALVLLLAAAAALGALAGLLRPLFACAGALLGWLAARHLAGPASRFLPGGWSPGTARTVAAVAIFLVVAGLTAWAGRRLARDRRGEGRPTDRAAGALLAGTAAAAFAWVGLSVAEAASPHLPDRWQAALAGSDLAALVRENDLPGGWRKRGEAALEALLRTAGAPGGAERFSRDPELRTLLDDPRVRALVEEARSEGRAGAARSPEALRLLSDPEFRERLTRAQQRLDREGRAGDRAGR